MITASTIPFVVIFHPWISIGQDKHVSVCSCIIIATSAGQDYTLSIIPLKLCRFVVATLSRIHRTRRLHLSREWVARSWYWVGVGLREIVRRRKRENKERISMLVTGACVSFGSANIAQLAPFKVRIFWRNASWRRLWLCFQLGGNWVILEENDVIWESVFLFFFFFFGKSVSIFERNF